MFRYALSARWIGWHLVCLVLVGALIGMGFWQLGVSTAPKTPGGPDTFNLRNFVYALQWWIFAAFGIWFWYRFIRDQRDVDLAEAQAAAQEAADALGHDLGPVRVERGAGSSGTASAGGPGSDGAVSVDQISLDGSASARMKRSNAALVNDATATDATASGATAAVNTDGANTDGVKVSGAPSSNDQPTSPSSTDTSSTDNHGTGR